MGFAFVEEGLGEVDVIGDVFGSGADSLAVGRGGLIELVHQAQGAGEIVVGFADVGAAGDQFSADVHGLVISALRSEDNGEIADVIGAIGFE